MKIPPNMTILVSRAVMATVMLCLDGHKQAVAYISPRLRVKATRMYSPRVLSISEDCRVTIGKPNFLERKFVRACQKAGEKFPIRKVQVRE